ncbi:MAG TPA: beta-galactosidase [Armatimonadota bacterium]|jgi:hypothetical protein
MNRCLAFVVLLTALATALALAAPADLPAARVLPGGDLRAYGKISAQVRNWTAEGGTVSITTITCESPAKAALLHAKYVSDLQILPGVTAGKLPVGGKDLPAWEVQGQGWILAGFSNVYVFIVAGATPTAVASIAAQGVSSLATASFAPTVPVPMYLNKWDRWGFGFWFADPLRTPENDPGYDVRQKLDWAQKMQVSLQFYMDPTLAATGEGVIAEAGSRWAAEDATRRGLPVFVQTMSDMPGWVGNRFPEQMQRKVPDYVGNWYGPNGFNGWGGSPYNQISWASQEGLDSWLATMAPLFREYAALPNCTGYGEWHGEVGEGPTAMFMDYGPTVDAAYRRWLRGKYLTPAALDKRWGAGAGRIKAWEDVRLPEPAEFLGWGPQALDLKGQWKRFYQERLPEELKDKWGAVDLDDAAWQTLTAPGDDHQINQELRRRPTIYRRGFDLTQAQRDGLVAKGKVYLYVWTLDGAWGDKVQCFLNGKSTGDAPVGTVPSWVAFEVTSALQVGRNTLALRLPWGELSYRVYLSPDAPRCFPDLSPGLDARWVDYRDFISWMREDCLRRGIETIRREDPDKPIKLYAPGGVTDIMKALAEDYGCYWHDTGGMSGNWDDLLPSMMRSSGKQMSIEPGNAAAELPTLKRWVGNWFTEAANAIDYFADITDVMWRPDQKAWFEDRQPLIHLMGKFHFPPAAIAVLHGSRSERLTGWPWSGFQSELLWWTRNHPLGAQMGLPDPRDVLTELDIMRGGASRYRIIVDDNTFIMDDDLVNRLEEWVRAGGIFVAGAMTGRHSTTAPNTWKLARLTGYKVIGGNDNWRVGAIPGQTVFTDPAWSQTEADGTPVLGGAGSFLEKVDPSCQDLARWGKDGAVAIGWRPLGQGKVITLGSGLPWNSGHSWADLLAWCNIPVDTASAPGCRVKHFVTNNGLQDLYIVFAEQVSQAGEVTLTLTGDELPGELTAVGTGAKLTGVPGPKQMVFSGLAVEPLETYAFLAPRRHLASAPADWLGLQRDWWGGTKAPAPAPVVPKVNNTLDLSRDWAFSPVPEGGAAAPLVLPTAEDRTWARMNLGLWYSAKFPDVKHGVFRKRFTVPAAWGGKGRIWLWIRSAGGACLLPPYQVRGYLDGTSIWESKGWLYSTCTADLTAQLTPGPHLLALDLECTLPVGGIGGEAWLEFIPDPPLRQSLAGDWGSLQIPGKGTIRPGTAKYTFVPNPAGQGKQAVLYGEAIANNITGLYLNGRQINREIGGQHFRMNLTPFLRWNQPNTIELIGQWMGEATEVKTLEMRYYERGQI